MKPTLKQLKKRPALWFYIDPPYYPQARITMPDKTMWAYLNCDYFHPACWKLMKSSDWHQYALIHYKFAGWL